MAPRLIPPTSADIISCRDARARGLRHYFTGRPCKRGHITWRYSASGLCYECHKYHIYARLAARAEGADFDAAFSYPHEKVSQ